MNINKSEIASIIGKGLVGAIPIVGPLAAEIVGSVIPNQRIERIESLLKLLEAKLDEKNILTIEDKLTQPEYIDLVEDSFIQASRALSIERRNYIASLLKNSLNEEQTKYIEYKKLLSILGDLNDIEILQLKSYSLHQGEEAYYDFWGKHEDVLSPPSVHMGSSQEELDQNAIFQTYKMRLISLGLLKIRYKKPKRGETPDFDEKTGMVKANGHDITSLGRLLLKSVDELACE